MPRAFRVRVQKEAFTFCAAHFITFNGDTCERLHGHNYRVAAEVAGPLDDNQYVVDFIALRDALRELSFELDHRVLLPDRHPLIRVEVGPTQVVATFRERQWSFPREDCVLLPVANTTAELLAAYLGERLLDALEGRLGMRPATLRVEVDECEGQMGVCELTGE